MKFVKERFINRSKISFKTVFNEDIKNYKQQILIDSYAACYQFRTFGRECC